MGNKYNGISLDKKTGHKYKLLCILVSCCFMLFFIKSFRIMLSIAVVVGVIVF